MKILLDWKVRGRLAAQNQLGIFRLAGHGQRLGVSVIKTGLIKLSCCRRQCTARAQQLCVSNPGGAGANWSSQSSAL